jgi:hypothetical protein
MATVLNRFGARPAMATAIRRIREADQHTAALTNSRPRADGTKFPPTGNGLGFDVVIESVAELAEILGFEVY